MFGPLEKSPLPFLMIVLGNLVPFWGIAYGGWQVFDILYLYWVENIIIGLFVVVRMFLSAASLGALTLIGTLFSAAFFIFHYGIFTMGHGVILVGFFSPPVDMEHITPDLLFMLPFTVEFKGLFWALAGILLVETMQGLKEISKDRSESRHPRTIMFSPYGRIIILHMTVLFGGGMMQSLGTPVAALALLVIFKILYDMAVYADSFRRSEKE